MKELPGLTSLRFVIAFVVFLFHCHLHCHFNTGVILLDKFISNGAVFMTAFFVLSGYVMAHVYGKTDFTDYGNIKKYYIKRFAKIYPIYVLGSIIYCVIYDRYSASDWLLTVANELFLSQSIFKQLFGFGFNGGTWSISVEVFFYLLFPFIIIIGKANRMHLLIIGIVLSALYNLNNVLLAPRDNAQMFIYANPLTRINEFIIGVSFYLFRNKLCKIPTRLVFFLFVLPVIFVSTASKYSEANFNYMGLDCLITIAFALLVHCVSLKPSIILDNRFFVYLGKISYSFYIFQFFAIQSVKHLNFIPNNSIAVMCVTLGSTLLISSAAYHLIEEPLRKNIVKRFT